MQRRKRVMPACMRTRGPRGRTQGALYDETIEARAQLEADTGREKAG